MTDHRYRPEVEILSVTDTGRRRRWPDAEKVRIVEESLGEYGQVVAATDKQRPFMRVISAVWVWVGTDGPLNTSGT
jgi:transposase